MADVAASTKASDTGLVKGLGLVDSTTLVAGSMIGSGIFLVSAEMARQVGAPGWLLVAWVITGVLTIFGALSYGELAGMMPHAGGQYVYLREAFSPLWGFLYGWTFFLVIQTGTIAAVAVGFARYLGVLWPAISENEHYLIDPIRIGSYPYALSLSRAQLVGILLIALLTWMNTRGLQLGKLIQNVFTFTKTGALIGLILLALFVGWNASAVQANFHDLWTVRGTLDSVGKSWQGTDITAITVFGLFVGICVSQTNSLFSADAWNNITFTAGEVRNPRRDIPLSLFLGTFVVITLYLLANVAYLVTLPLEGIQGVKNDRIASATMQVISPNYGAVIMAVAIMISTFGCNNGLILAGSRAYYAMALDRLFVPAAAKLNSRHVPAWALVMQAIWASILILPRTIKSETPEGIKYGNLYGDLLDYIMSAAILFYIATIIGVFRLRRTRPDVERPYKTFGYPLIPILYLIGMAIIITVLFIYKPTTTWPGLVIVATGFPVYFGLRWFGARVAA